MGIAATLVEMLVHMMLSHIVHAPLRPLERTVSLLLAQLLSRCPSVYLNYAGGDVQGAYLTALLAYVCRLRLSPVFGVEPELLLMSVVAVYSCQRTGRTLYLVSATFWLQPSVGTEHNVHAC